MVVLVRLLLQGHLDWARGQELLLTLRICICSSRTSRKRSIVPAAGIDCLLAPLLDLVGWGCAPFFAGDTGDCVDPAFTECACLECGASEACLNQLHYALLLLGYM